MKTDDNKGWGDFLGDYFGKHKREKQEQKEINAKFYAFENAFYANEDTPEEEEPEAEEPNVDEVTYEEPIESVEVNVMLPGSLDKIEMTATILPNGELAEEEPALDIERTGDAKEDVNPEEARQAFLSELEEFRRLNPNLFKNEEETEKKEDSAEVKNVKVSKPKPQKPKKADKPVKEVDKKTTKK